MAESTEDFTHVDESTPADLVAIGAYPNYDAGFQHALVVLAMGRACWIVPANPGYRLLVEPFEVSPVETQLKKFDRESVGWPPVPRDTEPQRRLRTGTPLLWSLLVIAAFWAESADPRLIALGSLNRDAVLARHEWWRILTALFLHADIGHLLSNALSGIFVFSLVLTAFGRLRGWLLLVGAAALGNLLVVGINSHVPYDSIGASTAIFAGVGLLTGSALQRMRSLPPGYRARAMFGPLASGVTVLALYGAGGVHIDVGAHVTGFVAGLLLGLVARRAKERVVRGAEGAVE